MVNLGITSPFLNLGVWQKQALRFALRTLYYLGKKLLVTAEWEKNDWGTVSVCDLWKREVGPILGDD